MTTTLLLLFLAATGVDAADSPTFLIERIDVRGLKAASDEIVRSESLLEEGGVYSEQQIRDAERRLRRLPFVFDIEMRLERGSVPGAYLLAIEVVETKAWFFGLDANPRTFDDNEGVTAGRRWFVGRNGVLHGALNLGYSDGLEVGYTTYNLFDRAAVLSLNLRIPLEQSEGDLRRHPSPELVFILPLTHRQALRFDYEVTSTEGVRMFPEDRRRRAVAHRLEGVWQYRSTDDPFFPRRGSDLEGGLTYFQSNLGGGVIATFHPDGTVERHPLGRRSASVVGGGNRYVDLGNQLTLGGGLRAGVGTTWVPGAPGGFSDSPGLSGTGEISLAGSLWSEEKARERGPFRWETAVGATAARSRLRGPEDARRWVTSEGYFWRAGVGRRNPWGVFRLFLEYEERR